MDESVKTKEEIMLGEIVDMFKNQEFGFDVFVLMKDEEKTIKRFAFYEKSINGKLSFKDKIQNSIVETIKRDFEGENEEYALIECVADNQHRM